MSSSTLSNGTTAVPGRVASVYSEVQTSRLNHSLALPSVLKSFSKIVDGPNSSAAGNPDEIAKLFPNLYGQPSASLVPSDDSVSGLDQKKLKIGVVLSGGQAPGGHNVISGIYDYLQDRAKGSTLYGFKRGPAGIMKCKYVELNSDFIYPYRNQGGFDTICSGSDKIETPEQFQQTADTSVKLDLDGLVVIGGDDSNTNACLLAENFRTKNLKTKVIGCPKTIDGDLKCKEVPTSFGFDTACKGIGVILNGLYCTGIGPSVSVENVGLLGLTRVGSRRVVQISAGFMIFFSMLGKFGALFASIPFPIFAALYCILFGLVGSVGISFLQFTNMNSMRNLTITGLSLFLGLSIPQYFWSSPHLPVHTHAGWFNAFLNTIFMSPPTVGLIVAVFLDNTLEVEKSKKDRGMPWWVKFRTFRGDNRNEEFYNLPFNLNRFFPPT